ncbi:50S ribosomal protein L35 [Patescibacteria group bacterium]|nr:50S ribosomal protein L35 [Patescibacteria group bacterium]MBU1891062.1 50S ribosomal protein L35 [Patescibacteria group bacterium]
MPKLKTHKATSKRYKLTGKKKMIQRQAGQDHFNSRESGNTTRSKRRDQRASKDNLKALKKLMPYL